MRKIDHEFAVGDRVKIACGPLRGEQGVVAEKRGQLLSLDLDFGGHTARSAWELDAGNRFAATEAERRVLAGGGQQGCAVCEKAARKLGVPLGRPAPEAERDG